MLKKTTPTHTFNLPFASGMIDKLEITYSQINKVILKKNKEDVTLQENAVVLKLASEETLKFNPNLKVRIQLFIKTIEQDVVGSHIIEIPCEECLSGDLL